MNGRIFTDYQMFSHVLRNIFPMMVVNSKKEIQYVNELYCQFFKYNPAELIGEHISKVRYISSIFQTCIIEDISETEGKYLERNVEWLDKEGNVLNLPTVVTGMYNPKEKEMFYFIIVKAGEQADGKKFTLNHFHFLHSLEQAVNETNAVVVTDIDGNILFVNKRYCELYGYKFDEVIGKNPNVVKSGFQDRAFYKEMWETILQGKIWSGELRNRAKDGSIYWVQSTTVPILDDSGRPIMFIAIQTDITDRIHFERSLQKKIHEEFKKTVRNLYNIVFKYREVDGEIKFTLLEGRMAKKMKLSLDNISMEYLKTVYSKEQYERIEYHLRYALKGKLTNFEIEAFKRTILVYLAPIFEDGEVVEVVGTIIDITNRKRAEDIARKMAYFDFLTQLPNRRYLQEKAEEFIFEHEINQKSFAVMFIDIDRFKNINDSMGHSAGDQLLVQLSKRLQSAIRKEDFIARHGGDEFVVLINNVDEKETHHYAGKIVKELKKPFNYRNLEIFVRPSIGISMFPRDGIDFDSLLGSADIAMYKNKKQMNSDYQFFTETLRQNILERTLLEMDLQQAVEREQLELYYQPKIDLRTREITGVEALVRWRHPVRGYISPGVFIPLAEETGTIVQIGDWVMRRACEQLKEWLHQGYPPISMAINISTAQFNHPMFDQNVKQVLDEIGLDPKYINLELTESMMLDKERSEEMFHKLRRLGVSISIDDFGTGYSSLSYLSNFPITHLKIDKSFIRDFNKSNKAIIETIISLAKALDMKVVAEGVELKQHERFLVQSYCDEAQGYFYAKPMPARDVEKWFAVNQSDLKENDQLNNVH